MISPVDLTALGSHLPGPPLTGDRTADHPARFVRPGASLPILRHVHPGAGFLGSIVRGATPGFRPALAPMRRARIADVRDDLFLRHDLDIFNFLIPRNRELTRRGTATGDAPPAIAMRRRAGSTSSISKPRSDAVQRRMRCCSPIAMSPAQPVRSGSARRPRCTSARLVGSEPRLALVANGHPLATLGAGCRLMLHGLATGTPHGVLRHEQARRAAQMG